MRTILKGLAGAIVALGLVAFGAPLAASAHHATLSHVVLCDTATGTYTVQLSVANSEVDKVMTVTASTNPLVGVGDTVAEGATRVYTVGVAAGTEGTIDIDISWPNGVTNTAHDALIVADYPACPPPVIVPPQPMDTVTVTSTDATDCATTTVTTTTVTTTTSTAYDAATNTWVATAPVSVTTTADRVATAVECPPVVVESTDPPVVTPDPVPVSNVSKLAATGGSDPLVPGLIGGGIIAAGLLALAVSVLMRRPARHRA